MHAINLTGVLAVLVAVAVGFRSPSASPGPPSLDELRSDYANKVSTDSEHVHTHSNHPDTDTHSDSDSDTYEDPRFQNLTLPHPHASIHVKRADVHGFYECSDMFFKGTCAWTQIKPGEKKCYNRKFKAQGSFGPDKGVTCTCFEAPDCATWRDSASGFTYPGTGDYANDPFMVKANMWVGPSSWICDVTGSG